jgi:hypothetical protein
VKTAGFFKGLQTARQKHERDYFLVRLRLTIPQRMNCTPKVRCQRIFADVLALIRRPELSSYVHSPIPTIAGIAVLEEVRRQSGSKQRR